MKAFTLIETLIAIAMILLAVMGPFQLVQQSLSASYVARDQLIATALAEEGVELVRDRRDRNYLVKLNTPDSTITWLVGLDGSPMGANCLTANGCTIDGNTAVQCGTTCPILRLDSNKTYTQQASGPQYAPTRFTRKVVLEQVNGSSENAVKVIVTVTFTTAHQSFTTTVTDHLYNWL